MRNFDNLSINYFFAHACTQYFPCLITTENNKEITKQQKQSNLKTKQKFKTMQTSKQNNKKQKQKKNKKTGFVTEIA